MLLQDEQYVVKWLSQYGALPKAQITKMLRKPPNTAEKILRNLKKQMRISDVSGGYYIGLDAMSKPDQRMILAVWVLLKFIDQVDPLAHYPAVYPAQLFFLKENIGYEIVVLYEGEERLLRLLQPDEDLKYIIILPHIGMANGLKLPDAPCLFATVDYGIIFIENLRVGKYTVTELDDEMSEGYRRPDPVTVELVTDETLTVNVHNEKVTVDVPKTGDDSNLWIWGSLLGLSALGAGALVFVDYKRRKRIVKK